MSSYLADEERRYVAGLSRTTEATALDTAVTPAEGSRQRIIRPLGEQIIIRTLPPDQIGSIIVPQSAKGVSKTGTSKDSDHSRQLQYVNRQLFEDMAGAFEKLIRGVEIFDRDKPFLQEINRQAQKAVLRSDMKTMMEEATEPIHFVEADVIACGPGKRVDDQRLYRDMADLLARMLPIHGEDGLIVEAAMLVDRFGRDRRLEPLSVKPGDRILYHPAVQKYDREIDAELIGLEPMVGSKCYIIREESILAVVERDEA